jgi:hypothetical protein
MITDKIIGWSLIVGSSALVCAVLSLQMLAGFVMGVLAVVGAAVVVGDAPAGRHECVEQERRDEDA